MHRESGGGGSSAGRVGRWVVRAAAIVLTLSGPVVAEEGPGPDVRVRIASMMAQERAALTAVTADRLRELGGVETPVLPLSAPARNRLISSVAALNRVDAEAARLVTDARFRALTPEERQSLLSFSVEEIDLLPEASGDEQWRCLAEALYFEARGESIAGQVAVAEVILNRVEHSAFPSTVCDVVHQGSDRRHACQFSFMCDGKPEQITESRAFRRVAKIARIMLDGQPRVLTGGATHFHTANLRPRWSKAFERTARIGDHVFYRL